MTFELLELFFLLDLCLILFNIIGKLCLYVLNIKIEKKFFRLFLELVSGLLFTVVLYSIIITKFLTVNDLFIIPFLYHIFLAGRRKIVVPNGRVFLNIFQNLHKDILTLFLIGLPFFLFETFLIYNQSGYKLPNNDYFYYASLSDALNTFKRENVFLSLNEFFPDQYKCLVPYHYFELWLNAIVCKAFHCSSLLSLLFIIYPILNVSVFIGLIAFWELYYKVNSYTYLIIFLMFFIGGVWFARYYNYILLSDNRHYFFSTPFTTCGKKFAVVYLFFILFLLLFLKNRKRESFIALGCLCIFYTSIAPAIFGGVIIFLLFNSFHKTFTGKDASIIFSFYLILSICFFLLYQITNQTTSSNILLTQTNLLKNIFSDIGNISFYKFFSEMFFYKWLRMIIAYLPFMLFFIPISSFILKKNKDFFRIILIVLLLNLSGSVISIFGNDLMDASQFFQNTFVFNNVLLIFLFLYGLIYLILNKAIKKRLFYIYSFIIIFLFIGYNVFQYASENYNNYHVRYSSNYIDSVLTKTEGNYTNSVCLLSKKEYENEFFLWITLPGNIMQYSYGYKNCININAFSVYNKINSVNENDRFWLENSIFYIFAENQKKNGVFHSYEQSQIDFIDKYDIKFLFAEKDAEICSGIKSRTLNRVIDPLSGEQFYLLR
jgi:hypothetical protein